MDTPFVVKEKMSLVDTMMLIAVGSAALMFGVTALLNPNLPPHSSRYGWGSIFRLILEDTPTQRRGMVAGALWDRFVVFWRHSRPQRDLAKPRTRGRPQWD